MKRSNVFMFLFLLLSGISQVFSAEGKSVPASAEKTSVPAEDAALPADSTAAQAAEQPQQAPASTSADLKKQADLLTKKGKTKQAFEIYKQCVDMVEDDSYGREALIVAKKFYADKNYDAALHYLGKVDQKNAESLSFKTMLGSALQKTGKNDSAITLLQSIASNQKVAVAARKDMFQILGDAYLQLGKTADAASWYGKYIRSGGVRSADIAYVIALETVSTTPAKAPVLLERNIKSFPGDYRNYLLLGKLQSTNRATLQHAVTLLKKALSLSDTLSEAWFVLGQTYQRLQKPDDALDAYRNSIRVDSTNLAAKLSCGQLLIDKGSAGEAAACLEAAHRQAPDSTAPMMLLSMAYARSGKAQQSIDMLENVKKINPANLEVRRLLFSAYQSSGNDQKAMEEITAVLEAERDRESLYPYAKLLLKMGKYDDAVAAIEEIVGAMPDDLESLMLLASVYRAQKKLDDAVNVFKEISSIDAKYAPALYERAEVHLEQDKAKWAEMFFQRALAADPQMAMAEVGLAKVARLFKDEMKCDQHLANAQSIAGDDPVVKKAIAEVRNPSTANRDVVAPSSVQEERAAADESGSGKKEKRKKKR